jgi:hypothetical protein
MTDEDEPGFNRAAVEALPHVVGEPDDDGDEDDGALPGFDYR